MDLRTQIGTDEAWFSETGARRAALAEYRAMLAMGYTHEQAALAASHLMHTVESDFGELEGPEFGEAASLPPLAIDSSR